MAIKFPSLSDLTISPSGAGTRTGSGVASGILGEALTESRTPGFDAEDAAELLTLTLSRKNDSEIISNATSVYQYDSSFYDTEITGSGITSAYPVVIATLPMENFFKAGNKTNLGTLYDIQSDLKDTVISGANEIVQKYYESKPEVTSSLALIRDTNLEKYNKIVENVPQIFRSRESIVEAANLSYPSELQLLLVDQKVATTTAELGIVTETETESTRSVVDVESILSTGIGNLVSDSIVDTLTFNIQNSSVTSVSDSGNFGNLSISYADDDITKYTTGKDIISKLSDRLIGADRNEQAKTTRQYQLLKAALAQISEGRRFNDVENESSYTSPYADLSYRQVSPISSFLSQNIAMNSGFEFAKKTIKKTAEIINNGYKINSNTYEELLAEYTELHDAGIMFGSNIYLDENSSVTYSPSDGVRRAVYFGSNLYDEDNEDKNTLPVAGIDVSLLKYGFIEQIPLYLASRILEESNTVSVPAVPESIDPETLESISVNSTSTDSLKFVSVNKKGENIYLFDDFLNGSIGSFASPISSAILSDLDDLETLRSDIDTTVSQLDTLVEGRKFQISNQCALTIIRTLYSHISSFFTNTTLGGSTSSYSAMRMCLFLAASRSSFAAARVYRFLEDGDEILGRIGRGQDAPSTGNSSQTGQTIIDTIVGTSYEYGSFGNGLTAGYTIKSQKNSLGGERTTYTGTGEDTQTDFLGYLFEAGGSFSVFDNAVNELTSYYMIDSTYLRTEIKLCAYYMFLYLLRKLDVTCYFSVSESENTDPETGRNLISYSVKINWYPSDVAFIVDSLSEAIENATTDSMQFSRFNEVLQTAPTDTEKEQGSEYFFNAIRGIVATSLQASQDLKSLVSYQQTVLKTQSNLIGEIKRFYENLAEIYGGDSSKALKLVARYSTLESVVEMLHRSNRYQTLVPDTNISSVATHSSNYRSIVQATFRDLIPKKENLRICVVGIPYGMMERMRFAQDDRNYYFGISAHAGSARSFDENSPRVDYQFKFIENSQTSRPLLGGPFCSLVPDIYDSFSSNGEISNITDDSISFFQISNDGSELEIKTREESSSNVKNIDIPGFLSQAALQSYVEDVYGLYPRYASFKEDFSETDFPEISYADEALKLAGYGTTGSDEDVLQYYRFRSVILFHKDFVTSRMISEIEASPLFDKIVYILIDGNEFEDIVNEFYIKVEV